MLTEHTSLNTQCCGVQNAVRRRHSLAAKRPDYERKGVSRKGSGSRKNISSHGDEPQRITGKVGSLSVQTQIKLVEQYRSLTSKSGADQKLTPRKASTNSKEIERSGYRKSKDDVSYQEELAQRKAAKQPKAQETHTKSVYSSHPILLVDGYNICGCAVDTVVGAQLKQLFQNGELEAAQKCLIEELENFAVHCGYTIVCVFDADRSRTTDKSDQVYRVGPSVWVVFSVINDADSWIEQVSLAVLCGGNSMEEILQSFRQPRLGRSVKSKTLKNFEQKPLGPAGSIPSSHTSPCQVVFVATNDNALSSIVRSNGAYVISAQALVDDMSAARKAETAILKELAMKVKFGGERRGIGMFMRDSKIEDKLMALYLDAPRTDTAKHGSAKGGFSGKPKKGKKNKRRR